MEKEEEIKFHHIPVMTDEVIHFLHPQKGGIYVDCTLGGGGHTELIAKMIGRKGLIIGIDRDIEAIQAAKKRLAKVKSKIVYIHNNFRNLVSILDELNINSVDGILLDLGVSSFQLENPKRGFSFKEKDDNFHPNLDMRMDTSQSLSAYDVINRYSEKKLKDILYNLGEEPFASKIARQIVKERKTKPIMTVNDLLEVIRKSTPPRYRYSRRKHYASKVFRAIRMEVNQELPVLKEVMPQAVSRLKKNGRLVIISFHSLEDRIVKNYFRELARQKKVIILTPKPLIPTEKEITINPKARSAKLRAVEKI